MYDLIIIGMGPAGMSAGIYAKRAGLKVKVLEKNAPGGLLLKLKKIDNYLGFSNIDASTLALKMFEHFNNVGVSYEIEDVKEIIDEKDKKIIKTDKNTYNTKNILITSGMQRKKLKIKNEEQFIGKGVSYCIVCDASLYKDKEVAIIGNEDAIKDVNYLRNIASKIYFINVTNSKINVDNAEVINNEIKELIKEDKFKIKLNNNKEIDVDGIFVNLGTDKESSFDMNLNIRNEKGFIEVNNNMETKIKGIYAAGDVIKKDLYQICTAVSEGAIAVNNIKKTV